MYTHVCILDPGSDSVLWSGEQRLRAPDVRHRGDGAEHADGSPGRGPTGPV